MSDNRMLNIVDEDGNILGEETREDIHANGLMHREIHVWFYTPDGEVIFQHRAKDKDTYPDLLDATVGGHVEIGSDYVNTAIQEITEETGIRIERSGLVQMKIDRVDSFDEQTKKRNNSLRAIFAYCYKGRLEDLEVEEGKAIGFESWPIEKLLNMPQEEKRRFIPTVFEEKNLETFIKIRESL